MRGVLQREWHVYCGGVFGGTCEGHSSRNSGTQGEAKRYFKKAEGWRETEARGWLCPRCAAFWTASEKEARQEARGERRRAARKYVGTEGM